MEQKNIVELLASLPTWQSLLGTTLPNVSLSAPNMHFLLLLRLLCMCHSSFALHSVCNAGKHNSHLCQASKCVVVDLTHHPHQCCCMKCPSISTSIVTTLCCYSRMEHLRLLEAQTLQHWEQPCNIFLRHILSCMTAWKMCFLGTNTMASNF